jgi:hypothetical protein
MIEVAKGEFPSQDRRYYRPYSKDDIRLFFCSVVAEVIAVGLRNTRAE